MKTYPVWSSDWSRQRLNGLPAKANDAVGTRRDFNLRGEPLSVTFQLPCAGVPLQGP
jgi:hypothetical protein